MHIVLVDDNKAVIDEFKRNIKDIKEITEFKGFMFPNKALEYIKENDVDVAFLDIRLIDDNDTEGIELARKINIESPATRIIFATDYNNYYEEANELDINAYSYITKPLTKEKIIAKINKINSEINGVHNNIEISMFGNFTVNIKGKPLMFHREKSRIMLAYILSKKGAAVSTKELHTECLSETEQYRNVYIYTNSLEMDLKEHDASKILIKNKGEKSVLYQANIGNIKCDYYDFLDNDDYAIKKYNGEFCKDILVDSPYAWNQEIENKLNSIKGI